jgi:hypothetical protein
VAAAKKTIVFVLGMHRSGTSLTAELVHAMGFAVPGTLLGGIDSVNARGFWESAEVVQLNENILAKVGRRWFHVGAAAAVQQQLDCLVEQFQAEISDFLLLQSNGIGNLVIKDPRLCLLLPVWLRAIDPDRFAVRLVYVNRHPAAVAASLAKRDGFPLFAGELLWLGYLFALLDKPLPYDCLFVDYERLLASSEGVRAIANFLGVAVPDERRLAAIVDSSLQRNRATDFSLTGEVASMACAAYEQLCDLGLVATGTPVLQSLGQGHRSFMAEHAEFVAALDESNAALAAARADAVSIGNLHQQALDTITGKDADIQRLDGLLAASHARIAELEAAMSEFEALRARLGEVEASLAAREAGALRSKAYIDRCEARIAELHDSQAEFDAVRARLAEVEAALLQRHADVAHNTEYIEKCHQRIAELHDSLAEFEALRTRIGDLETLLQQRDTDFARNAGYIQQCELRIAELHEAMADFEQLRAQLAATEAALQQRHDDVQQNTVYIQQCEARIAELDEAMVDFNALRSRLEAIDLALQEREQWLAERDNALLQRDQLLQERDTAIVAMQGQITAMAQEIENGQAARCAADEQTDRVREVLTACEARLLETETRLASLLSSRLVRLLDEYIIKSGIRHD